MPRASFQHCGRGSSPIPKVRIVLLQARHAPPSCLIVGLAKVEAAPEGDGGLARFRILRNWQVPQVASWLQGFWEIHPQNLGGGTIEKVFNPMAIRCLPIIQWPLVGSPLGEAFEECENVVAGGAFPEEGEEIVLSAEKRESREDP